MAQGSPAISVESVRKAFGPTVALDDVSLEIGHGTVHAPLGENGAGKSALVKLLSDLVMADQGEMSIFGEMVSLRSLLAARHLGIQTAFQEMTLVSIMTVLDNMQIPAAPIGLTGMIRRGQIRRAVSRQFD